MNLYTVNQGKHYFKGEKFQLAHAEYFFILLGIILGIIFGSWWYIAGSALLFVFSYFILSSSVQTDSARVFFYPNCKYILSENYDQVNKLFGFAEGFHHWNSARVGWRCTDGENIELLAYAYIDGVRIIKPMIKCKTESWVFCSIQNKGSKYVFKTLTLNNQSITVSIDKSNKLSVYSFFKLFIYRLYPYFGGKIAAPHKMELNLTKLKLE